MAQRQGVGLAIKRSRTTTLGKLFTPMCLDADTLRCYVDSLDRGYLYLYFCPSVRPSVRRSLARRIRLVSSCRTRHNQYDAAGSLACARRRNDVIDVRRSLGD